MPWGLYVHIPFCPYKCSYCDFVAVAGGPRVARWRDPYARELVREARYWAGRLRPDGPPATVFYGGGTPTLLEPGALAALHAGLGEVFGLAPDAEVTAECNPGTVDEPALRVLRAAGVNRLSIGLQAAQDRLLASVGRRHSWADFVRAWQAARGAGFDNVNVDVMCGLPGQSLGDVEQTLARLLALRPEHVSAYALQLEPGTPLHARARHGQLELPGEDAVADQLAACRRLGQAGYEHYEVSNFARPGRRCRHNLLYWQNEDWLGLGVGAHSHWHGARWENTSRLAVYRAALDGAGAGWVAARQAPDAGRARSEGAFLGLRLLEGIDLRAYARRYGVPLAAAFPGAVERLVSEGLCEVAGDRLRLRPEAVAIGNRAFAAFV